MRIGISRKAFKVWLSCTILFWIAIGIMINAGGFFPAHYQTNFTLQPNLPVWQKQEGWDISAPLRKPLYEIIRSPSAEKLSLEFQWRGYQGPYWNQHIHARQMPTYEFPSGETLDLPTELTDADRDYIKQAFWNQKWSRWKGILIPYLKTGIFLPIAVLVLIWMVRQLRIFFTGKEPPPEAPRLPYSPTMIKVRKFTIVASCVEIVFWVITAIKANIQDPQPFVSVVSIMLPMMLPSIAALIMSLLWRGPVSAALLSGLGGYFLLTGFAIWFIP